MDAIELKILIGLHRVSNEIDRRTTRIVKCYGLSMGQFAVLEALFHKGDLTIGQVQEKILSTSGTIPVIIKNLEKRGLLIRLPDAGDKRKCILHITEQGSSLIQRVYPENEALIIESMHNWTNDEKCELLKLLKKFGGGTWKEK